MSTYTICTTLGEFIADRVTKEQICRLLGYTEDGLALSRSPSGELVFGTRLIRKHKKRDHLYIALVDPSVIRSELLREFACGFFGAEDNTTTTKEPYGNDRGSGWLYQHNARAGYYGKGADGTAKTIEIRFNRHPLETVVSSRMPVRAPLAQTAL